VSQGSRRTKRLQRVRQLPAERSTLGQELDTSLRRERRRLVDHQWFDELTCDLAGVSRREGLRLLGGGLAGGLLALFGVGHVARYPLFNIGFGPSGALADDRLTDADFGFSTFEPLTYRDTGYRFQAIPLDAAPPSGWEQPGFDDSSFDVGSAAFGSGEGCPLQSTVQTSWPSNSQLLVRRVISIPPQVNNLRIMISVDNDILGVFFNGTPLVEQTLGTDKVTHDECPVPDEFRFNVPQSAMQAGNQIVAFHLLDRGFETFFDARILADLPVNLALAVQCSDTNEVSVPCAQLSDYLRDCGTMCPDGQRHKGLAGCTTTNIIGTPYWGRITFQEDPLNPGLETRWCASTILTVEWVAIDTGTEIIHWQPPSACCAEVCSDHIHEIEEELLAHEAGHQRNCSDATAQANRDWAGRSFRVCSSGTRRDAEVFLRRVINEAIARSYAEIRAECQKEPSGPPTFDCSKCVPAGPGKRCVNGTCQNSGCSQTSFCQLLSDNKTCRCAPEIDCSKGGTRCRCVRAKEGDIRCGRSVQCDVDRGSGRVSGLVSCSTSADCERRVGQGAFCQDVGVGCCGGGVCIPPC
jgi:hypothetical protein